MRHAAQYVYWELICDFFCHYYCSLFVLKWQHDTKSIHVETHRILFVDSIKKRVRSPCLVVSDAVALLMGKGDVVTNPKPSCVFRGQFPCLSLPNPLHCYFNVFASKITAVGLICYMSATDNQVCALCNSRLWTCTLTLRKESNILGTLPVFTEIRCRPWE